MASSSKDVYDLTTESEEANNTSATIAHSFQPVDSSTCSSDPHELLICGICEEPYDDNTHQAKFLSCHHTFCSQCLTKLSNKEQVNPATITCPNCRSQSHLPENGVAGLQTNFYITSLKEMSKQTEQPSNVRNTEHCHKHTHQTKSYLCTTCGISVCRDCITTSHSAKAGHLIISITDIETSYLQELNVSQNLLVEKKRTLEIITSEITSLTAAKDVAVKDTESLMKLAQQQQEKRRNDLINVIMDKFNTQQNVLLDKKKQMEEAIEMLDKSITQAKAKTKTGHQSNFKTMNECLKKTNDETQMNYFRLDLGESYFALDSNKGLDEFKKSLFSLGRIYTKGFLPTSIAFRSKGLIAGHTAEIKVEVHNHNGDQLPISSGSFSVKLIDPLGTELHAVLCPTKCTVTFTPQMGGPHQVSGMFLEQKLMNEETHISVSSNNPVLKFGGKGSGNGTLKSPKRIAIDDNCLYVVDYENKLIQKFTAEGDFLSQFSVDVHNKNCSTLDLALDADRRLLYCTETFDEKDIMHTKNVLVFDLNGELQHTFTPSNLSCAFYLAINKQNELIVTNHVQQCLSKLDCEGKFLCHMGHITFPGYFIMNQDDSMIVPDMNGKCVKLLNPNGTINHHFGSPGTGKGQLKEPRGVATDGENILVGDAGNNRIQVFTNGGAFVSMIESSGDPLSEPRGLAITKDGHVYVADSGNHCIKKYKYKDVS